MCGVLGLFNSTKYTQMYLYVYVFICVYLVCLHVHWCESQYKWEIFLLPALARIPDSNGEYRPITGSIG